MWYSILAYYIIEYNIHIRNQQVRDKDIYTKDHKYLVEKLKKARLDAGLDQKAVGEILGRTQSYVSKIESGQRRIDIFQLKEFARIYKKDLDYFVD